VSPALAGTLITIGAAGKSARGVKRLALPGRGRSLGANDPAVTELSDAVNACLDVAATDCAGAPIALFVDGLDKLEIDQVESFFSSGILALPLCTMVYTAPLALKHGLEVQAADSWSQTLQLGNFRVFLRSPNGARDERGFEAMRELLDRRLKAAKLAPEDVFADGLATGGLVDRLIEASGGITRTFVRLCDVALRQGLIGDGTQRATLGEDEVDAAIHNAEQRTVLRLRQEHVEPLIRCWTSGDRPGGDEGDRLLFYNLVHCYFNGWPWYRPTPLVIRYLRDRSSKARSDAGST